MDHKELQRAVNELLGFRVTERGNDAIVEFFAEPALGEEYDRPKIRAVHPATRQEVTLYLKVLGFVARLDEMSTTYNMCLEANAGLQARVISSGQAASDALARAKAAEAERDDNAAKWAAVVEENTALYARIQDLEAKG